jgi:multiple sugar transport system permease protein
MNLINKVKKSGFGFILPLIIFLLLTIFFPILYVLTNSFFSNYLPQEKYFVGFENYYNIFTQFEFWNSVYNTIVYVVFTVSFHIIISLFIALFLSTAKGTLTKISKTIRTILIIPWLLSWAVAAAIWLLILDSSGVLNSFGISLGILDFQVPWLGSTSAMNWIILITVWKSFPFFMMFIYAAITTVPDQLYEAAEIDGATFWEKFYHITLKYIMPTILTLIILDIVWSIRQFDIIYLTTGGGPLNSTETLSISVYFTAFEKLKFGIASTKGVVLFIISSLMAFIYIKFYNKIEFES